MPGPRRIPAVEPRFIELDVLESQQVSPHIRRVTLGGEDVPSITALGYDQWFRFLMRREHQDALAVPSSPSRWFPQYLVMGESHRPHIRNYTIREFRPEQHEIDIDFVTHEDPGPGAAWALRAERGERAVMLDEGLLFNNTECSGDVLVVGDESAIPAVAGIAGSMAADANGLALIEVESLSDRQHIAAPKGFRVEWLERGTERVGQLALRTLQEIDLPKNIGYAYSAGEQALAAGMRRHLVKQHRVDKQNITFTGYWRLGKAYMS